VKKNFKVKKAIEESLSVQEASLKKYNITVTIKGKNFTIYGFRSEFQQVILNIIANAIYALKNSNTTDSKINIHLTEQIITITDNASGIKEEILDRIFEPYFTTKEQGEGTGIGLYMSKVIIEENMGGSLRVSNQKESGASFMIDFSTK